MAVSMISNFGIFSRYLVRRTFLVSCFVFFGFIALDAIFVIVAEIDDLSDFYSTGDLISYVFGIMPHRSLAYLEGSCLLGILISMSISNQEGNLSVLRSAGFSPFKISSIASLGAIGMILIFLLGDEVYFKSIALNAEINKNISSAQNKNTQNLDAKWIESNGTFLEFYLKDKDSLYDVSVVHILDNRVTYSASANKAIIYQDNIHLIEPVTLKYFNKDKIFNSRIPFIFPKALQLSSANIDNIKISDQFSYLRSLKNISSIQDNSFKAELEKNVYTTISIPFSALAIMLLAGSFMFGSLREASMGTKIVLGVVCGFLYGVFQDLLISIFITYALNILMSVLIPIFLSFILCIFFYRRI